MMFRKEQEQYWAHRNQLCHYIPIKEFAKAFHSFHIGKNLTKELSHPYDKTSIHVPSMVLVE